MASGSGHNSFLLKSNMSLNSSLNASFNHNQTRTRHGKTFVGTSEVLYAAEHKFYFDLYGQQLPSMVKVALNVGNANELSSISCRLDPNGWAWLVHGRRLYVWKYTMDQKKTSIACRELSLPASELVHSANLICVLSNSTSSNPACIAVSPEGHITYWPNIANNSSTVTVNADITGQECDFLTSIWPTGCLLTTTSCTVLLVKPLPAPGNKPSLSCISLGLQKGWLGGLKKMTQGYLFPPVPAATSTLEMKRAKVVVPMCKDDDVNSPGHNREGRVYIVLGTLFQTWRINAETHQHVSEVNLHDLVKSQFHSHGFDPEESRMDIRGIQVWILDAAAIPHSKQVALFAAAKGQFESSDNLVYGLIIVDSRNPIRPDSIQFIKIEQLSGSPSEEHLFVWKLVCATDYFVLSTLNKVVTIYLNEENGGVCDIAEGGSVFGGPILGHGLISPTMALVFSSKHGIFIVKVTSSDQSVFDETFSETRVPDHLALSITQSLSVAEASASDEVNRYKSAMINYVNRKIDDAMESLSTLFPSNVPSLAPHDPLDISTVALCEKLVDDAPVSDPRWGFGRDTDQDPLGMKSKILIKNFLTDKKEGLELFFGFLSGSKLRSRLKGVIVKEDVVATASILFNCYEKIGFALALQTMQTENQHRKLIDTAIKSIIYMRSSTETQVRASHLSYNDLFYKDISRIQQIIPALITIQEDELGKLPLKEMPQRIYQTNEILLRAYHESTSLFLAEKIENVREFLLKPLTDMSGNEYEIFPWHVQPSVLKQLERQHTLTVNSGIPHTDADFGLRIDLIKQLVPLTDLILSGLKENAESIHQSERYRQKLLNFEKIRGKLLRAHVEVHDYDGAMRLAEKFLDFEILVMISYEKKDMDQLESHFLKYDNMNFPEFTFEWYVKQQKTAELVDSFSRSRYSIRLGEFIKKYPRLAWHHDIINKNFGGAGDTLKGLADVEEASADDKKFMLCMAKLCALANSDGVANTTQLENTLESINKGLDVLEYQNNLPDTILNNFGLNRDTMRVLNATELIDMFTNDEVEANTDNYWRARELLQFMPNDAAKKEKLLFILSRLIMRDEWAAWSTDHPLDSIEASQLYQFLVVGLQRGDSLEDLFPLPSLSDVDDLKPLLENANVIFLLRACYEHLATVVVPSIMQIEEQMMES